MRISTEECGMVQVAGELQGNTPVYNDDNEKPTMSRRSFSKAALVGLGVLGVGGAGAAAKFAMGGKERSDSSSSTQHQEEGLIKSVTLTESRANIAALTQSPETFSDEVDPHVLVGISDDEIMDKGGVDVTDANREDIGVFGEDLKNTLLLFLRAGNTRADVLRLVDEGVEIGVRDERGNLKYPAISSFGERINHDYGVLMLEGMGAGDFYETGTTPVRDSLLERQRFAASQFVEGVVREEGSDLGNPTLDLTTSLTLTNVEELDLTSGAFANLIEDKKRVNVKLRLDRTEGNSADISITVTYFENRATQKYVVLFEDYTLEWL